MKRPRLKFPIEAVVNGELMTLVGCDMLTGWFFQGFPDPMPLTDCWKREDEPAKRELMTAMEAWHDSVVCRGVWIVDGEVCRRFTPEMVQRLGDQRDHVVLSYMSGIGWIRPEDKGHIAPTGTLPRRLPPLDDPFAATERRAAMTRIPSKNLLLNVKYVASAAGAAPHTVWRRWWISEFIWTHRAQELEHKERAQASGRASTRGLPEDFAHIGVEA